MQGLKFSGTTLFPMNGILDATAYEEHLKANKTDSEFPYKWCVDGQYYVGVDTETSEGDCAVQKRARSMGVKHFAHSEEIPRNIGIRDRFIREHAAALPKNTIPRKPGTTEIVFPGKIATPGRGAWLLECLKSACSRIVGIRTTQKSK